MDVCERFLKYVSFHTTSDEDSATVPSSARQLLLGQHLADELTALGLSDVRLDECGYVYGFLPATEGVTAPTIGLIAHMDTSPAVSGENIRPTRITYQGGDISLAAGGSIPAAGDPLFQKYVGQELIVTDGTTLLGADDKAGIAEIITAVEYLIAHPEIPHGRIAVGFTPDEEIGRGADHFDVAGFGADFAYTVDGGELGEIEYENFNGASVGITVHGFNIHPGSAKNRMKNAVLIAAELIGLLPPAQTPAHTEGYEGFFHVCDIAGDESKATLSIIIRDHDREKFEQKKVLMQSVVNHLNTVYGEGTVVLDMADSYYNMKEKILPVMHIVDRARDAMTACGVTPCIIPIRGGTDGARLSYEGLPCPNLSTGGANFHGVHEFVSVNAMEKMVEVLVAILRA